MKNLPYLAIILMSFPACVFAAGKWELLSGKNTMAVAGVCSEKEVRFDLYRSGDAEPIYTSGVLCRDGAFEFSDNLLQWESLADGSYELVVDKERDTTRQVVLERPIAAMSVSTAAPKAAVPDVGADTSTPRFLDAFVMLQRSLIDMRIRLAESEYPDAIKMGLDAAIDGIDKVAGTMADLLFASETGQTPNTTGTSETALGDTKAQAVREGDDVQAQPSTVDEATGIVAGDATGLLSTDGLIVDGGSGLDIAVESDSR